MGGNTFGRLFRLTTFGESHGKFTGGIIDGCPPGLFIDESFIQSELGKRRTAGHEWSSPRKEPDQVEFISGIFNGKTTGTPIAFIIKNQNTSEAEYETIKEIYRPSHGDYTYEEKYGIRDYRGGGRASARETLSRVVGGAIAKLYLKELDIDITGFVSQIGPVNIVEEYPQNLNKKIRKSPIRCPDESISEEMIKLLQKVKDEKDTIGGGVNCIISGVPAGLGEPVFEKIEAELAGAMLSIPAAKGFEIGTGFKSAVMKGSEHNDPFIREKGKISTSTNHSGGVQAGISNGMDIRLRVAFKPPSGIGKKQTTINKSGEPITFKGKGRYDVCVLPRAVAVVEAMAALVIVDLYLRNKTIR